MKTLQTLAIIGLMSVGILAAPLAHADPTCVYQCRPTPPWNGQLMPTWRAPGYYGGWSTTPIQCDPFTYQCRGIAPNPNG